MKFIFALVAAASAAKLSAKAKHITKSGMNKVELALQNGAQLKAGQCEDWDDLGETDIAWDGCDWYWDNQEDCGERDDDDFSAYNMCCACGGGMPDYYTAEW